VAFTSYDNFIAARVGGQLHSRNFMRNPVTTGGQSGLFLSMWGWGGTEIAGSYAGTALAAVSCDDTFAGAIPHGGNVSAKTKHLSRLGLSTTLTAVPTHALLYDRLLYYPGIDATSVLSQTLNNSVTLPRYTDGRGVRAWLEVTTAFTTGTGVFTASYTSETGGAGAGQTLPGTVNTAASRAVSSIPHSGSTANNNYNPFLPLKDLDIGVKSVESVQFTAAHAVGVCALVLGYPLAMVPIYQQNTYTEKEMLIQYHSLARVYDGSCLSHLLMNNAANLAGGTSQFTGEVEVTWN